MNSTPTGEAIFVSGIDTDAGKTYATAWYARASPAGEKGGK